MLKSIPFADFAQALFDSPQIARKVAIILKAILDAQSPRLSEIAQKMPGKPDANYKQLQRFLQQTDPQATLLRLFQTDAPFVIGDPTEIPRPQAKHTSYVGTLMDGETRGFWLLTLATPFRGRALPFHFVTYSSQTIAEEVSSRNLNHLKAVAEIHELLGEKPLVFDREFSYLELLENLVTEQVHFVIRLKLGRHPPRLFDSQGQLVTLTIAQGETEIYRQLSYKGQVKVNVIGTWKPGLHEPLWVMTDLKPERGLQIYFQRMHVDESFRDLKTLLRLGKLMNKQQGLMEKMVALVMLAYSIGLITGEEVRDVLYGVPRAPGRKVTSQDWIPNRSGLRQGKKWKLYSGLFIVLEQKVDVPLDRLREIFRTVLSVFTRLIHHPVRTYV